MSGNISIKENLQSIKNRITDAEKKSGRPQGSVKLMAVSKFHPAEAIVEAYEAGSYSSAKTVFRRLQKSFRLLLNSTPSFPFT